MQQVLAIYFMTLEDEHGISSLQTTYVVQRCDTSRNKNNSERRHSIFGTHHKRRIFQGTSLPFILLFLVFLSDVFLPICAIQ